jgi:hypothetical protein
MEVRSPKHCDNRHEMVKGSLQLLLEPEVWTGKANACASRGIEEDTRGNPLWLAAMTDRAAQASRIFASNGDCRTSTYQTVAISRHSPSGLPLDFKIA